MVKWILLAGFSIAAIFALYIGVKILQFSDSEFDPARILDADQTLILYDAQDAEIDRLHSLEDRVNINLEDLPDFIPNAFISAEDKRFYQHFGIDIYRIFGSIWADIKAMSYVQGASTITQMLIKLSHLTAEKTMTRKLEEAVLACRMETLYTKDEILEMYLNYVYFGGGYYGIEAAAQGYFGVHAKDLSLAQAALLAGVIKSPSRYAPHLDLEASVQRRNHVLGLMCNYGYISEVERDAARAEETILLKNSGNVKQVSYYVNTALDEAAALLGVDYETLLTGGYRIYTAMDSDLQTKCEDIFEAETLFPKADVEAAIVVQHAGTGLVAALVGGRSEASTLGFNRATDIRRQPGSVIKPIIVYAPALEQSGYTAASMILDEQTDFGGYRPSNFGGKYYGWVTLREAVTRSLNVPAVKVLNEVGVEQGKAFAQQLGITFSNNDGNLALALGGFSYGVSPYMIAGAYNCFASGGVYNAPAVIRRILDSNGNVLYEYKAENRRVMSEENAYVLTSLLQSVIEDGTGHRLGELGIDLAGKTGTVGESEGNRDAWMAAYNSEYTAAVWMGYDSSAQGSLPDEATGGSYPALVLAELFKYLYAEQEAPAFQAVSGIVEVELDEYTLEKQHEAVLASSLTPASSIVKEIFVAGTEPTQKSSYWTVPLAAADFTATLDGAGYPTVSFTPQTYHAIYTLYRQDIYGNITALQSWSNTRQAQNYTDYSALGGASYTYYVIPTHPSLKSGGNALAGPSTRKLRLTVPFGLGITQDSEGNTLDLTDLFG